MKHVIRLIDVDGNECLVRRQGRMTTTSHKAVLDALLHWAVLRRKTTEEPTHLWLIDEMGMLDTSGFGSCNENDVIEKEIRELNTIVIPDEVLQVHGYAPPKKAEGIIQLVYENMNSLNNWMSNNKKVERLKESHDELEVDVAAYYEHKLNMKHKKNVNGFNELFKSGKAAIQSITAHNVHENVGHVQQGGTSMILFGHLTEHLDHNESRKDPTG